MSAARVKVPAHLADDPAGRDDMLNYYLDARDRRPAGYESAHWFLGSRAVLRSEVQRRSPGELRPHHRRVLDMAEGK